MYKISFALIAVLLIVLSGIYESPAEAIENSMEITEEKAIVQEIVVDDEPIVEEIEIEVISSEERDLIERVVAAEARGEPYKGIVAVAQVIKDRGDLWDMSYRDVVLAKGQFAPPYKGEISDDVKEAVQRVFCESLRATKEPITHFHSKTVHPYWADEKELILEIGDHKFYY